MALTKLSGSQIESPADISQINVSGVSTFINNVQIDLAGASIDDAVRINQNGSGNALLIQDQSSPDPNVFVVDGNGDVGIGTTVFSTDVKLSILLNDTTAHSSTSIAKHIECINGSPGGYSGISFVSEPAGGGNGGRSSIISSCDTAGNSNLAFFVRKTAAAVERVRISSDGYVGINTAIPGAPFEIRTTDQNPEAIKLYHSVFNSAESEWGIDFMRDSDDGIRKKAAKIKAVRNGGTSTSLIFATSATGGTLEQERLRINYDGKVGIGSTIPAQTLDVRSNDTRFNLTSDGSGQTVGMTLKGGASDGFTYNFIESVSNTDSQNWYIGGAGVANNFVIKTAGTERLRVNSNGRIGIRTDTIHGESTITVMPSATSVGTVAIGGSVSLGSGLKSSAWDGSKGSYATNGGLDIYIGNGSHALTVWDDDQGAKPRFDITRTGIVHHYFQPAFYARKTTAQTLTTTPTTIVYQTEEYDVASNYNTSTYRFTAPADGRYYIHAHILPNALTSDSISLAIYVNGSGVNGASDNLYASAERQTRHIEALLSLSENDYVEIRGVISSGTHGIDNSGVFYGFKVA